MLQEPQRLSALSRPSFDFSFHLPSYAACSGTARGLLTIFTVLLFPLYPYRWQTERRQKKGTISREPQYTSTNTFARQWYVLQKTFPLLPAGIFTFLLVKGGLSLKVHQMNKKKRLKSNSTTAKVHKEKINTTDFPSPLNIFHSPWDLQGLVVMKTIIPLLPPAMSCWCVSLGMHTDDCWRNISMLTHSFTCNSLFCSQFKCPFTHRPFSVHSFLVRVYNTTLSNVQ